MPSPGMDCLKNSLGKSFWQSCPYFLRNGADGLEPTSEEVGERQWGPELAGSLLGESW